MSDLTSEPTAEHTPENRIPIRRALVSVYDKTGLDALVRRYRILYQAPVRVTALTTVGGGYGLAFRLSW